MRTVEHKEHSDHAMICPFTLLPTPFPRSQFELAVQVQKVGCGEVGLQCNHSLVVLVTPRT